MGLCNHCCSGKEITVTNSECLSVALVCQNAKRMHCIVFSSVACLVAPYISKLYHFGMILGKQIFIQRKMFVLWRYNMFCETFLVPRRTERDTAINVPVSSHKVSVILHIFNIWIFSTVFRKMLIYQIRRKSVHKELIFFHADAPTDGETHADATKLIVVFLNLTNAPKRCFFNSYLLTKILYAFLSLSYACIKMSALSFSLTWLSKQYLVRNKEQEAFHYSVFSSLTFFLLN